MIVAIDATVLVFLFDREAKAPLNPETGQPVADCHARIEHLIAELQQAKAKIIIPAPALGEVLVYGEAKAPEWLQILSTSKHIRIAPFDTLAAVEFAAMERERLRIPKGAQAQRRKAKFDEQIVAIARIERADVIYSDDSDIRKLAGSIEVRGVGDLALPLSAAQIPMQFEQVEASDPHEAAD